MEPIVANMEDGRPTSSLVLMPALSDTLTESIQCVITEMSGCRTVEKHQVQIDETLTIRQC